MKITNAAQIKLASIVDNLKPGYTGLRFNGFAGSCRGSVPVLKPVKEPRKGEQVETFGKITLYIPEKYLEVTNRATMDYDPTFMGMGLHLSWPHVQGCRCQELT